MGEEVALAELRAGADAQRPAEPTAAMRQHR
jgi:hypothetical protein